MHKEVKTHLKMEDVNEHIERIRGYMDRRGLLGAVAGGIVPDAVWCQTSTRGMALAWNRYAPC